MVHNVLVFGSGYGNCRSLRPNGHDLNKTSQSIVSSFNILPRDHHPKNAKKKKTLPILFSFWRRIWNTHRTEKEIKYKRKACEMLCIHIIRRKKKLFFCALCFEWFSYCHMTSYGQRVTLDIYMITFVKLLAPKRAASTCLLNYLFIFQHLKLLSFEPLIILFASVPIAYQKIIKSGQKNISHSSWIHHPCVVGGGTVPIYAQQQCVQQRIPLGCKSIRHWRGWERLSRLLLLYTFIRRFSSLTIFQFKIKKSSEMMGKGIDSQEMCMASTLGVGFFFLFFFSSYFIMLPRTTTHIKKKRKKNRIQKERKQVVNSWWSMKRVDMLQLLEIQSRS